ncbi:MAG: MazG-like family protein, partial [Patescibacteria group bacterium]
NSYYIKKRNMDFNKLQKDVLANARRYSKKYKVEFNEEFALLKLVEEIGELFQAYLIHRKQCRPEKYVSEKESREEIAKELADVICMCIVSANELDIDLEEAIKIKWLKHLKEYK